MFEGVCPSWRHHHYAQGGRNSDERERKEIKKERRKRSKERERGLLCGFMNDLDRGGSISRWNPAVAMTTKGPLPPGPWRRENSRRIPRLAALSPSSFALDDPRGHVLFLHSMLARTKERNSSRDASMTEREDWTIALPERFSALSNQICSPRVFKKKKKKRKKKVSNWNFTFSLISTFSDMQ